MKIKAVFGAVLLSSLFTSASALCGVTEGRRIFEAKRCAICHQSDGRGADKTIKDRLSRKGPELWYAGSKFKKEFLEAWLKDPRPIRPLEYNSPAARNAGKHLRLEAGEAAQVASYLMSLKSAEAKPAGIKPGGDDEGGAIFMQYACYGCHEIKARGKAAGGMTGPSLSSAGARLQPDWIYSYISNPRAFKPVSAMPNYSLAMSKEQIRALASYVGGLN